MKERPDFKLFRRFDFFILMNLNFNFWIDKIMSVPISTTVLEPYEKKVHDHFWIKNWEGSELGLE